MDEPWFAMKVSGDGYSWKLCECGYFTVKARQAGFNPIKVGSIDHQITVTASLFRQGDETKTNLKFGTSTGGFVHG
jgi:hypothetical protein